MGSQLDWMGVPTADKLRVLQCLRILSRESYFRLLLCELDAVVHLAQIFRVYAELLFSGDEDALLGDSLVELARYN